MYEPQLDFSHISDEEFERNEHLDEDHRRAFPTPEENAAWRNEQKRRKEAKRLEEERISLEQTARLMAIKNAVPYSEKICTEICERVSAGEFLVNITRDENMPSIRRATQWLKEHSDFAALYRQAIESRLDIFEDEIVTIPDDASKDFRTIVKRGKEVRVADPEIVARSKLRVEARHRHLKAYRPQKWGEISTLVTKSDDNNLDNLSLDELEAKIADLETKDRIVKSAA